MKVLLTTAIWPLPGRPQYGTFVRTQVEALRKTGIDVDVLVLDGPNRKLIYPKGIAQLRRRIALDPPDLVHAHYSYVGAVARSQRRVPVVLTYHGDDILGTADASGRRSHLSRALARGGALLGELVDAVIVQSQEMARRFRREDVHVIPHEVDMELFSPMAQDAARAELGLDPDRSYVLFASSPQIPCKNYPLARDAVEIVRASRPDTELLVVHDQPQARVPLYMNAADVLVFTSAQEGSPNIVKQALACNLPIVSTEVGDVPELLRGIDGCHIVQADAGRFAERMLGELGQRRRTTGRAAVRHLTPERVAARVINVYEQTLARSPLGRPGSLLAHGSH